MSELHGPVPLLHDYVQRSAARLLEKTALMCGERRLTYADVAARSHALANALVARGVARGDRVMVFADNGVEAAIGFWAALEANAVAVMVNPLTRAQKLEYLLGDCRPAALIADRRLWDVFAAPAGRSPHLRATVVAGEIERDALGGLRGGVTWAEALAAGDATRPPPRRCIDVDLAAIIYTSGSTGEPKGVMLTHRNMLTAATSISSYLGLREDDVVLDALPLAFDYGLYQMIMAFRQGARLVIERSFAFPGHVVQTMIDRGVTVFPGVPTMFALLGELGALPSDRLGNVRLVTSTAAALSPRHIQRIREIFPRARLFSMYGLTECKRCTYLPPEDLERKAGSVGVAIPDTELWAVDQQDRRVGPGEVGQLVIRGATVMAGYWEKPEETARKLRPGPLSGERVLYTGDLVRIDEEGYVTFVGRMDDVIKSRGEKVPCREVERALMDIAGVREAAVIGVPDEILGEAVKAFVVLEAGADLTARRIQDECNRRLESFMVPRYVVLVPELPRTDTGKIDKKPLA